MVLPGPVQIAQAQSINTNSQHLCGALKNPRRSWGCMSICRTGKHVLCVNFWLLISNIFLARGRLLMTPSEFLRKEHLITNATASYAEVSSHKYCRRAHHPEGRRCSRGNFQNPLLLGKQTSPPVTKLSDRSPKFLRWAALPKEGPCVKLSN